MIAPILTYAGSELLSSGAISGEQITFTKFKLGNGINTGDAAALTDLVNPVMEVGITAYDDTVAGRLILTGEFTSADVAAEFEWHELGLYATGEDEVEKLFAYSSSVDSGVLRTEHSGVDFENTIQMIIVIDTTQNIVIKLSESHVYASVEALNAHTGAMNNPHSVTKDQVGLGNVPNKATNDQTPTFEETGSETLDPIQSGETLRTLFGKIKGLFSFVSRHVSTTNPHNISADSINAAAKTHTHNASAINAGILGTQRGGTGVSSIPALAKLVGASYLKEGSVAAVTNLGADYIMTPGYYFVSATNGGLYEAPGDATSYHLLVLGSESNSVVQIAIVPIFYTTSNQNQVYIREINIHSCSWSSWQSLL